jgi:phage gp45-like
MANPAPIIAAQNAFNDIDYTNAYLYIPKGETDEETQAIYDDYVDESNYWRLFLKGATSIDADGNNGISVGVGEVENDDIAVTTDGKAIEITGYEGEINVYNVAGMKVYQGTDNRIELPNEGIYVVIVNDKPYKLAIK